MALYDRLMGLDPDPAKKIGVHQFMGVMQEIALGNMTGAQGVSTFGLSASEATEATTLQSVIASELTAENKKLKAIEFERVLMLAEVRMVPFNTVALVKTRLGV
jgi:hypothetical protein